ncbi:MAG: recombinase family protein [Metallibacterium sp.]
MTEGMDTTTQSGELLFHVFGALAQYERVLTRERAIAGLAAAKRYGRHGGRPPAITGEKLEAVIAALEARHVQGGCGAQFRRPAHHADRNARESRVAGRTGYATTMISKKKLLTNREFPRLPERQ